jgi:hypothetical protein
MKTLHYLIVVSGGIEPVAQGPFGTEDERDEIAKEIHAGQDEDDCLFWADVNESGVLTVDSYAAGFFLDESTSDIA